MNDHPQLLADLRIKLDRANFRPIYTVEEASSRKTLDLAILSGRDNLGQAILMRLLTPQEELAPLGHPEYGSRLNSLIGRQNTETVRRLARLYILESLAREPRIAKVLEAQVTPHTVRRDRFDVRLRVQPIGAAAVLDLGPFALELGP
jgi:phage baseplate assembly protein W